MQITLEQERLALAAARQCASFTPDDEDEQAVDEPRSCLNCRYRRFLPSGFACMKK